MKYSTLLPQVALVFAVAYACSDSAAPANPRALLAPKNPTPAFGEPPPPPVDVAVSICFDICAVYDGTYFSNGSTVESLAAAAVIGEQVFDGTAWLKFDNDQPTDFATVSANARFKRTDQKLSGSGRFVIGVVEYVIIDVLTFAPFYNCASAGQICAIITFRYDGPLGERDGSATAFGCELVPSKGGEYLDCGSGIG